MEKKKVRPVFSVVDVLVLLVLLLAVTLGIYWQLERGGGEPTSDLVVLSGELEYAEYLDLIRPGQTLFDGEKNAIGSIRSVTPEIAEDGSVFVTLQCEIKNPHAAVGAEAEVRTKELVFRATVLTVQPVA